jgi:hypothetical protein
LEKSHRKSDSSTIITSKITFTIISSKKTVAVIKLQLGTSITCFTCFFLCNSKKKLFSSYWDKQGVANLLTNLGQNLDQKYCRAKKILTFYITLIWPGHSIHVLLGIRFLLYGFLCPNFKAIFFYLIPTFNAKRKLQHDKNLLSI